MTYQTDSLTPDSIRPIYKNVTQDQVPDLALKAAQMVQDAGFVPVLVRGLDYVAMAVVKKPGGKYLVYAFDPDQDWIRTAGDLAVMFNEYLKGIKNEQSEK